MIELCRRISSAFTEFVDILPTTTCLDYRKKRVPSRFFHFVLAMMRLHFAWPTKKKGRRLRTDPLQTTVSNAYQQKRQR